RPARARSAGCVPRRRARRGGRHPAECSTADSAATPRRTGPGWCRAPSRRRGRPGCGAAPARRGSPGRSRRDSPCCPPYGGLSDLNAFNFPDCRLYRVPGRFGDVLPPGRGDPAERPVGKLVDRPPGVLLEPVVASTFRAAITQARSSARLVRGVVLEVALSGGPAAARSGASRVPDPGQVPELDPGIMALGLEPVIALLRGDRIESDQQVRAASGDAKSPGAIPARGA